MFSLCFANPTLETRFRQYVQHTDAEVGGWFACDTEPYAWPWTYSRRALKRAFLETLFFVNSVVLAPNVADEAVREYRPWDWPKAENMAAETGHLMHHFMLPWHSHPNGNATPSTADIAFSAANEQVFIGKAWFAIVTPRPLRLWPYELSWGPAVANNNGKLEHGQFLSWNGGVLRGLTKGAQ